MSASTSITNHDLTTETSKYKLKARGKHFHKYDQFEVSVIDNSEPVCNSDGSFDGSFGMIWPPVNFGETSIVRCSNGNGFAKWLCRENGLFDNNGPDMSDCPKH